ncbi:F-box domain protein [Indivirus ILV1]|uniref:F-box domain protein n=1 Tax=Indivirus ILV1 TaxID=1977633 RepID=A0A1V0SED7_9VIRU|nr:F-box domain protein [Indivirus ILV1]
MNSLPNEVLYKILKHLSISDLLNCQKVCYRLNSLISNDQYFSMLFYKVKNMIETQSLSYDILTSKILLIYCLKNFKKFDYQYAISLLLSHNYFNLIDIILNYIPNKCLIDWNDYLFISTCQGNKQAIEYCIMNGANNFTEGCYASKLYQYPKLLKFFSDKLKE